MADQAGPPPPETPPARGRRSGGPHALRAPRETIDERRARQSAAALAAQVDLKREAAERRARKRTP